MKSRREADLQCASHLHELLAAPVTKKLMQANLNLEGRANQTPEVVLVRVAQERHTFFEVTGTLQ